LTMASPIAGFSVDISKFSEALRKFGEHCFL
jgi:hypothetical protein